MENRLGLRYLIYNALGKETESGSLILDVETIGEYEMYNSLIIDKDDSYERVVEYLKLIRENQLNIKEGSIVRWNHDDVIQLKNALDKLN